MTYRGTVKNGVVVLPPDAKIPEGAEVLIDPVDEAADLREGLRRFAGVVKDLPSDLARNHDHYLHGAPKK